MGGRDAGLRGAFERALGGALPGEETESPYSVLTRLSQWLLFRGRRTTVAFVLLVAVLVTLLVLSAARSVDMHGLLAETSTIQTLFSTLLSGSILLVSIVVSVTSIVLSQEITDIGKQRERVNSSVEYRDRIDEFVDADVSPARPAEFLRVILGLIDRNVEALETIAAESDDDAFREEAAEFAERVTADAERAGSTLADARFGTFGVLFAGLNYDYSWQLYAARRFERKYDDQLRDDERAAIDGLVETLKFFAIGREYFKSMYYKREFARLSSRLLFVSLPTIVLTSYVLLALDANLFPDVSMFGVSPLLVFVDFAYTVALAPYVILTSYVIRAMAVTLRTLSAGPFILQRGAAVEGLDLDNTVENTGLTVPGTEEERADD